MKAMAAFQEPVFRMSKAFFDSGKQIPEDSKAIMDEWTKAFKNYQADVQKTIDSSYGLFETFFGEAEQSYKTTTKK